MATHRPVAKHVPEPLRAALAFISDVNVSLHGILSVSAKAKPKASTVIRVMDAIERASRWRPLIVFFDEFQEIVENLEVRESRHNSSVGAAMRPFLKGNNEKVVACHIRSHTLLQKLDPATA
jgi:hypothetical protein